MTIDKIKHYMDPVAFEYWTNCIDRDTIKKAADLLESEINSGLLAGINYVAELKLLKYLLK